MFEKKFVRLDVKGHLGLPITGNRKYKIHEMLMEIEITQKDFEKVQGKWDDTFKRLANGKLDYHHLAALMFYLPDVIKNKLQKDGVLDDTKRGDFFKLCCITVYPKSKVFKETILNIHLDWLRPKRFLGLF